MAKQIEQAKAFHEMHVRGDPLVLYNVWDPGSARAVSNAGARAVATGSASVAMANGFEDGECVPLDLALANAARIVASVDLPVSLDFERGYGANASGVGEAIAAALKTGIVGCNIEDSLHEGGPLRELSEQVERIAAARAAADAAGIPLFINARTDIFFQKPAAEHDVNMVEAAVDRAKAYAAAGASGVFVPLLVNEGLIRQMADASPLPLNIMALGQALPLDSLAALGVARVSYGPGPYRMAMKTLEDAAAQLFRSMGPDRGPGGAGA